MSVVDTVLDCDGSRKAVAFGSKPTSCSLATGKLRDPSAELVVGVILGWDCSGEVERLTILKTSSDGSPTTDQAMS